MLHTQTLMAVAPPCGDRLQGYGRRVLLDHPRKRFLDFFWLLAPPFSASSTLNPGHFFIYTEQSKKYK